MVIVLDENRTVIKPSAIYMLEPIGDPFCENEILSYLREKEHPIIVVKLVSDGHVGVDTADET
ncbi:hypothetical protein HFO97_27230 [Rhizobium leguminosarum]|uniref:hypothetical protein n=1 Tax=Rhizobium leguminosarum TaxID=384 RepID=UPI001C949ED4|nr:hypothetical protein [Rhizobium leguminosarum]MBY5363576.1 hypothetical protein [Rhizobium leguminosarum]